jgi:hypothetical protein
MVDQWSMSSAGQGIYSLSLCSFGKREPQIREAVISQMSSRERTGSGRLTGIYDCTGSQLLRQDRRRGPRSLAHRHATVPLQGVPATVR